MSVRDAWAIQETTYGFVHVVPAGDTREHDAEDCWCDPQDEGDVIVHNSADGREAYERGIRSPH